MPRWTSSCMTTYSTKDASSIITRQLNLNVPSGAQLPHLWRWSRMSIPWFAAFAQSGPPTLNACGQALFGSASVPVHDRTADTLIALFFFQTFGYQNPKAPMVETDLRGVHVRRLDNQPYIPSEIRQGFTTDEALGGGSCCGVASVAENPCRPLANDGLHFTVRCGYGRRHLNAGSVHGNLDGLLPPLAPAHFVLNGGISTTSRQR